MSEHEPRDPRSAADDRYPSAPASGPDGDLPYLPPVAPVAVPTLPEPGPAQAAPDPAASFDAKAMVEAGRRKVDHPVYGQLPTGTSEGLAAARSIRVEADRTRRRRRWIGRVAVVLVLAGAGAGGYVAFRAYQDDQNAREVSDDPTAAADALAEIVVGGRPISELEQTVDALNERTELAEEMAGLGDSALTDVVEQAEDVVVGGTAPAGMFVDRDLTPDGLLAVARRLPDVEGFEIYVLDVPAFAGESLAQYLDWLRLVQQLPQRAPGDPALDLVPAVSVGEVAVAVRGEGGEVTALRIVGSDPDLAVVIGG